MYKKILNKCRFNFPPFQPSNSAKVPIIEIRNIHKSTKRQKVSSASNNDSRNAIRIPLIKFSSDIFLPFIANWRMRGNSIK